MRAIRTTYKIQFNVHFYHYHLNFIDEFQKDKILAQDIQRRKAHILYYSHVFPTILIIRITDSLAPLQPTESPRDRPKNLYFK